MKILYIDCPGGISGDMTLAAFIDMGIDIKNVNKQIETLGLKEKPKVLASAKTYHFIKGTLAKVEYKQNSNQRHRSYREIKDLIQHSKLNPDVKKNALSMFSTIAQAESKIHNVPVDKIHFHEIGAVDSIADIVGVATCFSIIDPSQVYFSKLPLSSGVIKTQHGILPLPAPASAEILKGIPVYGVNSSKELVTPTGAAIVKTFATGFDEFPPMKFERIGTGLSHNHFETVPSLIRIFEGSTVERALHDSVLVIEANIDNLNTELFGNIQNALFDKGALDVTITPIIMKKGRPANQLTVICHNSDFETITNAIFRETPTIGLRYYEAQRKKLRRESVSIKTPYGKIRAKKIFAPDRIRLHPEFDDLEKIAKSKKIPIQRLFAEISALINKNI